MSILGAVLTLFVIVIAAFVVLNAYVTITSNIDFNGNTKDENISIACWNLQIFGESKASNETLLNYYVSKLKDFDIFIIQEIRDISGDAIVSFADKFQNHSYIISARAGQSKSKEQYAIFFNDNVDLVGFHDFQNEFQLDMERPPFEATFTSNNWTFNIYTAHLDPDNIYSEFSVLEETVKDYGDTIILGDFNADGNYYDEDNISYFVNGYEWVIGNNVDTTVAPSSNTYDRIIISDNAKNNFINSGVMTDVTPDQSDHYLIYGYFTNEVS